MGGVQSGTNSLGDALWMHERQRQRSQRESARCEQSQNVGQNTHDRRKLLKRTRSLAVITEDTARGDRNTRENFHFGEQPNFSIPRRPQLIPRAKLIDRNSLKDRLSKSQQHLYDPQDRIQEGRLYSRSSCDLYAIQPSLSYFPEVRTPSCSRSENRIDSDRLNILDWPRTPRKYRSHQDLDTVSGLVDIVEDDWPIQESQNCDIYTQVKRKRKEHRSLDSILFEDEGELEYFDVLNLLPLSKVRLELDESDTRTHHSLIAAKQINQLSPTTTTNFRVGPSCDFDLESIEESERRQSPRILQVSEFSDDNPDSSLHLGSNVTDEEKCKSHSIGEEVDRTRDKSHSEEESWQRLITLSCRGAWETDSHQESFTTREEHEEEEEKEEREEVEVETQDEEVKTNEKEAQEKTNNFVEKALEIRFVSETREDSIQKDLNDDVVIVDVKHETVNSIGDTEDFKSIWVSDTEEDMSRRPQVLKVVDNDVTRRQRRNVNVVEIDSIGRDLKKCVENNDIQANEKACTIPLITSSDPPFKMEEENEELSQQVEQKQPSIENARNFFEAKRLGTEISKNQHNEGRFERIVKETTSIIGKACNAVKGSLGFEARSESSDLGLGSDCGSDIRRRSIDDGVDITDDTMCHEIQNESNEDQSNDNYLKIGKTNLTRSHSCLDSLECQPDHDGPEFDHIRYKIVKSRLFGKNIFTNLPNKGDAGYDGLMQYLREYSIQELLLDNNVVIIEPIRAEPAEIKTSTTYNKGKCTSTCRVAGSVQKKIVNENDQSNGKAEINNSTTLPKQSSLRKHFFYHPIRVNRELIDEELPDPDTVRNVRQMFESTLRPKSNFNTDNYQALKSISMKDLSCITERQLDDVNERSCKTSRSRCFSRAKDLTRLFEGLDKTSSTNIQTGKEDIVCTSSDSKTRVLAQSFEARSGNTSPSDSGCARNKITRYRHQNHRQRQKHTSWDAGSVSSGVSSDYPDTDAGSGAQCSSSEDEDVDCRDEDEIRNSERVHGHFVSQDVLKKIRECGTSVTYYGGKIVNTCNGPLISPMSSKINRNERLLRGGDGDDYVKFRLVKSNSCDSRLELTGRVIERRSRLEARELAANMESIRKPDLRSCTIAETPSIEITSLDDLRVEVNQIQQENNDDVNVIREPPVVIGLEPKKEEKREPITFKADFKLGKIDDGKSNVTNRFGSALMRWQVNETNWNKKQTDFGKMEFEEFEILEDSLNGPENC